MKKKKMVIVILFCIFSMVYGKEVTGLKVFISVDMEGLTGVVHWEEVSRKGKDYEYFRKVMTNETNAAVEGALQCGARFIVVRDSHGSARNIIPELLNKKASLLREWSGGFKIMMEGLDETFDAVIFIGYHAKAGTPDALLEHTMSGGKIMDVSINGTSLPEAGINALIAGHYNVPVVFLSGDLAICKQAKKLFGEVETVVVKKGIGNSALNLHPDVACEQIKKGVKKALRQLKKYKAFKMKPPYTLVLTYKREQDVNNGSFFPGVKRTGDWELTYKSNDLMEVMRTFMWLFW